MHLSPGSMVSHIEDTASPLALVFVPCRNGHAQAHLIDRRGSSGSIPSSPPAAPCDIAVEEDGGAGRDNDDRPALIDQNIDLDADSTHEDTGTDTASKCGYKEPHFQRLAAEIGAKCESGHQNIFEMTEEEKNRVKRWQVDEHRKLVQLCREQARIRESSTFVPTDEHVRCMAQQNSKIFTDFKKHKVESIPGFGLYGDGYEEGEMHPSGAVNQNNAAGNSTVTTQQPSGTNTIAAKSYPKTPISAQQSMTPSEIFHNTASQLRPHAGGNATHSSPPSLPHIHKPEDILRSAFRDLGRDRDWGNASRIRQAVRNIGQDPSFLLEQSNQNKGLPP
ncbi:MAG: hypothetical protein Q9227_001315 [Pyrenula ochraceoflavens]